MHSIWMVAVIASSFGYSPMENAQTDSIQCDVQIIHATKDGNSIDPALQPIARYLTRSFGSRYRSFRQIKLAKLQLGLHKEGTEKLPNNTDLKLKYTGTEKSLLRLEMSVGGLKTNVKVHNGGLFFQAGRVYRGGMLILAIRVQKQQ